MGFFWAFIGVVAFLFLAVVLRGAPYLPSQRRDIERAFEELYAVGPDDTLVDIGCGDGVVLRAAARRGAKAVGLELNPILVLVARWLSRAYPDVTIQLADMWLSKLPPQTSVVYVFSSGRDIEKIGRWVEGQASRLGRPIYLISYGFTLRRPVLRSKGAHHLYEVAPLQPLGEQV